MKQLGNSEIIVQGVVLGAWAMGGWYWGGTDDNAAISSIHASLDEGICGIDTAPIYGCGHSEDVVGRAIQDRRERVVLMTKVGLRWDCEDGVFFFGMSEEEGGHQVYRNLRPNSIRQEVEDSLKRLQTDYIDVLQCHWPDPSIPVEDTMHCLATLVKEGKIRSIGVSNYDVELLKRSKKTLSEYGIPLVSHQPRYSLLQRSIEMEELPWTIKENVGNIVYSPIGQGLLTGKVSLDRVFPADDGRSTDPAFSQENRQKILDALEEIRDLCETYNCSFAQLAIGWCIHQSGITSAIVGARTPEQAIENARAAQLKIHPNDIDRITKTFTPLAQI